MHVYNLGKVNDIHYQSLFTEARQSDDNVLQDNKCTQVTMQNRNANVCPLVFPKVVLHIFCFSCFYDAQIQDRSYSAVDIFDSVNYSEINCCVNHMLV